MPGESDETTLKGKEIQDAYSRGYNRAIEDVKQMMENTTDMMREALRLSSRPSTYSSPVNREKHTEE